MFHLALYAVLMQAYTFFATHYLELTQLETLYPNVEKLVKHKCCKHVFIVHFLFLFFSYHFVVKVVMSVL